jgi:excisionase family DNA binding protein
MQRFTIMRPLTTSRSAQAIAESVRKQLGTDAVVLILPGSPACAVVIATDTALASALAANATAAAQPADNEGVVGQGDGRLAYSVAEAAAALGVSRATVYDELRAGRLASIKLGRRRIITRQHIDDFLASAGARR